MTIFFYVLTQVIYDNKTLPYISAFKRGPLNEVGKALNVRQRIKAFKE